MVAKRVPGGEIAESEAADVRGPIGATLFVIDIPDTVTHAIDVAGTPAYAALATAIKAGRILTLKADGAKLWYRWDSASGQADETMTAAGAAPGNQVQVLADGERSDEAVGAANLFLMYKAQAACKLRIHISSAAQEP